MNTRQKINASFAIIECAAANGERCPMNWDLPISSAPGHLAREGKIRIDISGHNYRQVTILVGPYAGKSTSPDPSGALPWMVVAKITTRNGVPWTAAQRRKDTAERREAARQRRLNVTARARQTQLTN